jgi:hypothetical protein
MQRIECSPEMIEATNTDVEDIHPSKQVKTCCYENEPLRCTGKAVTHFLNEMTQHLP